MKEHLPKWVIKILGEKKDGNLVHLPIKDQVDILLNFLEEGKVLQKEFIATCLHLTQPELNSRNISCQRLIVLDNHPGITRHNDTGMAYDTDDKSNFTHERGSILYRENWYERTQTKISQQKGKASLAGLGLRFYPSDWFTASFPFTRREAIDLWVELKQRSLNIRLDMLKSTGDNGRLLVEQTARFRDAEDLRQQIIRGQGGFSTKNNNLPQIVRNKYQ
jgi:hypothetical protein